MANPVLITCNEGEWTKVATSVVSGYLRQTIASGDFNFWWTSRDTGEAAPSNADETDGGLAMPMFENCRAEEIASINLQDFYVWVKNIDDDATDSTSIRVDL